jgi:cell wall-associated NlpC family hydrolase
LAAVRAAVAAKWRAAAAASQGSGIARAAMNNALSRVGAPYVWGGQGPWGFDCSGLVAWAYRTAGYNMPGGSYNQIGHGYYVSYGSLAPGDLVFYGPGGSQHVAIYIGNGNVVQASNYNTGVHIASIWYIGSPTAYKRIG